ncbi:hypothetical protein BS47DRAFT_1365515 [Hydnum rufescens UP504]|uniref:Uncharacterized protein n=1 Tax=Hydnum rufescens UP504 TaxID=1448309 RepID=A0A9P6AP59_9AGAM|nr:hypothetical protein BS47DRAFT_1365515 [Hydnum rufescens UP504]
MVQTKRMRSKGNATRCQCGEEMSTRAVATELSAHMAVNPYNENGSMALLHARTWDSRSPYIVVIACTMALFLEGVRCETAKPLVERNGKKPRQKSQRQGNVKMTPAPQRNTFRCPGNFGCSIFHPFDMDGTTILRRSPQYPKILTLALHTMEPSEEVLAALANTSVLVSYLHTRRGYAFALVPLNIDYCVLLPCMHAGTPIPFRVWNEQYYLGLGTFRISIIYPGVTIPPISLEDPIASRSTNSSAYLPSTSRPLSLHPAMTESGAILASFQGTWAYSIFYLFYFYDRRLGADHSLELKVVHFTFLDLTSPPSLAERSQALGTILHPHLLGRSEGWVQTLNPHARGKEILKYFMAGQKSTSVKSRVFGRQVIYRTSKRTNERGSA